MSFISLFTVVFSLVVLTTVKLIDGNNTYNFDGESGKIIQRIFDESSEKFNRLCSVNILLYVDQELEKSWNFLESQGYLNIPNFHHGFHSVRLGFDNSEKGRLGKLGKLGNVLPQGKFEIQNRNEENEENEERPFVFAEIDDIEEARFREDIRRMKKFMDDCEHVFYPVGNGNGNGNKNENGDFKSNVIHKFDLMFSHSTNSRKNYNSLFSNKNTHIFIGEGNQVEEFFKLSIVRNLQFKIGIGIENVVGGKEMKILVETRKYTIRECKTSLNEESSLCLQDYDYKWIEANDIKRNQELQQMSPLIHYRYMNIRDNDLKFCAFDLQLQFEKIQLPNGQSKIIGVSSEYIQAMASAYNFTFDLVLTPNDIRLLNNGTWTFGMRWLVERKVDVMMLTSGATERTAYADPSSFSLSVDVIFVTGQPDTGVNWKAIFLPFTISLWIAMIVLSMSIFIFVYIRLRFDPKKIISKSETEKEQTESSTVPEEYFYPSLQWVFGPLLCLGIDVIPQTLSMELFALVWLNLAFIVNCYYQQDLLSLMCIPQAENYPRTFPELAVRYDFNPELMYLPGFPDDVFFQKTTDPLYRNMNDRLYRNPKIVECISNVLSKKKNSCIGWHLIMRPILFRGFTIHRDVNAFVFSTQPLICRLIFSWVQKNSKYAEAMLLTMTWLREGGFMDQWFDETEDYNKAQSILRIKQRMSEGKTDEVQTILEGILDGYFASEVVPLGMDVVITAFGILAIGLVLAAIGFIFWEHWKDLRPIAKKPIDKIQERIEKISQDQSNSIEDVEETGEGESQSQSEQQVKNSEVKSAKTRQTDENEIIELVDE